ncbi:GyrI-like domain-containing protein [Vagococcus xieshaowenii]|uniref:DNA gyrase inhibitory protein n=1 Tax=Vagococcus xieshaowenii TaxID=2562451 RepID=A0AAJ5EF56_9ENTE|nr:GyrI-like domain-containing protein [Vagococcus xieshaowenii]QCA28728.1 DNA gyrase inhibitory protein [Vagococcus xieshaowenii]TFZ40464.1 DNA gyrase inhibitory protein [Vagococcus xieshaowenii]
MSYIELEDFDSYYKRRIGHYGTENHYLMEDVKQTLIRKHYLDETSVLIGIALDDPIQIEPALLRYDVGVKLSQKDDRLLEEGFDKRRISGGKYQVIELAHTEEAITSFWSTVFSGGGTIERDVSRPILEWYSYKDIQNHTMCMYIPIK